jgi:ABC-2 type transport system ATP-binding protein
VLRLASGAAAGVKSKIDGISAVERSVVVSESPLVVRAFPRKSGRGPDFARAVGEVALRERWAVEELHTEEGRLDEVFRDITLPDTGAKKEEAQ